jgi:hypothetical protein
MVGYDDQIVREKAVISLRKVGELLDKETITNLWVTKLFMIYKL